MLSEIYEMYKETLSKSEHRIFSYLLEHEQLRHISPEGNSYNVSVNAVDTRTLRRAFEAAVRAEDYERAAELRDELERRARKK